MRTGQLAERSGVHVETIRYYERVGLLPTPARNSSGYRAYRDDHLKRLIFLRRSRELGFSLKEVRDLLGLASNPDRTCSDITRLATSHLNSVRGKVRELRRLQRALEKLTSSCPGRVSVSECGILGALTDEGHSIASAG